MPVEKLLRRVEDASDLTGDGAGIASEGARRCGVLDCGAQAPANSPISGMSGTKESLFGRAEKLAEKGLWDCRA